MYCMGGGDSGAWEVRVEASGAIGIDQWGTMSGFAGRMDVYHQEGAIMHAGGRGGAGSHILLCPSLFVTCMYLSQRNAVEDPRNEAIFQHHV